ncbi:hypothetical protein CMU84_17625 [Elizabethkingia anophelis]|nr:hypothetical protein [Elizabethkingia anophelis]MDV3710136.1 hypothetical protein [Elizabethkingia anophelis]MDV3733647.1 hypothetical protein [Elizabethkingia anophelis]
MIGIILGIMFAFILVFRSIESSITNKKILNDIERIHYACKLYFTSITRTTFKTASKGILVKSIMYVVWFLGGLYMVALLIFGIIANHEFVQKSFILDEFNYLLKLMVLSLCLSFGLRTDFPSFLRFVKEQNQQILKSPLTWILFTFYYILIIMLVYCAYNLLNVIHDLNIFLFFGILFKGSVILKILLFPIFLIIVILASMFVFYSIFWGVCRIVAYLAYVILRFFLFKSQCLNPNKPLKPLLLIIQSLSLIITPIIVLIKNLIT